MLEPIRVKKKSYIGSIEKFQEKQILINVNHLEKGHYKLKIVNNNKIIKSTHFSKE
ncbi:hypothetical protein [Psychroserpens sp.]|uniref:hypothetical protein n=1 Tax=Psychroserpens sp. TaxID=2020870 RepID=UPI00385B5B5D